MICMCLNGGACFPFHGLTVGEIPLPWLRMAARGTHDKAVEDDTKPPVQSRPRFGLLLPCFASKRHLLHQAGEIWPARALIRHALTGRLAVRYLDPKLPH